MSFCRHFLHVPSQGLLRLSAGPGDRFQEDLPCIEESGLDSDGDGVEQISTTFQQLREAGSEEGRKSKRHVLLEHYPNYGTPVPKNH